MRARSLGVGLFVALSCLWATSVSLAAGLAIGDAAQADAKQPKPLSDLQVKNILIAESIAEYSGNRPGPYSTARNGSRCGKRSAWSRAGGAEPLCYPKDVTHEMVEEYRTAHAHP